ncbi:SH3 domain-containing protein [Tenacibaculum finnmarkense]|uniref:SH3 domain-containing protein n=1 Tax=Tenacibaculum finnmarkense TaxID=2781243 RepID=UPI001E46D366|nr:SH3 domain-containing protein [Tenacibaculum finnmarkense]MCD8422366.1 SH3 domain-containing protein [Tenacibaculum finnmarkense genomovar ulcerans]MCG8238372.1 SH3 domain-containing protein [Tenacibaculum finnmarkense genomovar ulcerans]
MENKSQNLENNSLIKGLGITGLVIGIVALVLSFVPCIGVYSIFIGIIGLIISGVAFYLCTKNNDNTHKGIVIAGMITSFLGFGLGYYQKYTIGKGLESLTESNQKFNEDLNNDLNNELNKIYKENKTNPFSNPVKEKKQIEEIKEFVEKTTPKKPAHVDIVDDPAFYEDFGGDVTFDITVDMLRLRTSPTLGAEKIENLKIGSKVEYLGARSMNPITVEIKNQDIEEYWYKVKSPSGKTGWIHGCCFIDKKYKSYGYNK